MCNTLRVVPKSLDRGLVVWCDGEFHPWGLLFEVPVGVNWVRRPVSVLDVCELTFTVESLLPPYKAVSVPPGSSRRHVPVGGAAPSPFVAPTVTRETGEDSFREPENPEVQDSVTPSETQTSQKSSLLGMGSESVYSELGRLEFRRLCRGGRMNEKGRRVPGVE